MKKLIELFSKSLLITTIILFIGFACLNIFQPTLEIYAKGLITIALVLVFIRSILFVIRNNRKNSSQNKFIL